MPIWNYIRRGRFSLVQEYLYFSAAVLAIIIASSFFLIFQTLQTFEQDRHKLLYQEAQKIQMFFDERIMYIEHILQFIGTKISSNSNQSLNNIADTIMHHKNNFNDEAFSWNMFALISPDYEVVADSIHGLIKDPISIATDRRPWLLEAQNQFWRIKFSKPDVALIGGDYVLPTGISIPERKTNKLIWYLTAGISIEKITSRLLKVARDSSFIILDNQHNIITSSEAEMFSIKDKLPIWLEQYSSGNSIQRMNRVLSLGNFDYSYAAHSEQYPFVILIGQDRKIYNRQLRSALLPRILTYLGVGLIFASSMLFLGYQVIRPLLFFGKAADAISKGQPIDIPKYQQRELRMLGSQLEKIDSVTKDLRHKQTQLSKINHELQNANSFIKNNMSFLSHELTNPISSIMGFAQLLNGKIKDINDSESKEYAEMIHKTAIHQNKQLNFFLRMFQFQEARKKPESKEIDLKQAIEWNVSMIRHYAKEKDVRIKIEVETGLKIMGDEIMIGQLIQNLAANAAKYNKQGGEIIIRAYSRYSNQVAIDFIDTGIGIAEHDISRIFKKFTRIRNTEQKKTIGYGIGLAYAKRCALLHNGKILVRSKLGIGSIFTAILPKN